MTVTDARVVPTFEWDAGIHPAADLFPMMDAETFSGLVEDVRANGLIEPIWLTPDGLLLDGRNRLAACQLVGIEPATRTFKGDDPVRFVLGLNVHRRHMTPSELAVLALEVLPLFEEQARARQLTGKAAPDLGTERAQGHGRAATEAAAAVGTSPASVKRAKALKDHAPDLLDQVKQGDMTVTAAERLLAARKKHPVDPPRKPVTERVDEIRDLAATGHTSAQIGARLNAGPEHIRNIAREHDIKLPDAVIGRVRKLDPVRISRETVSALEGLAMGVSLLDPEDFQSLTVADREEWATSLKTSMRSLNRFMKEMTL